MFYGTTGPGSVMHLVAEVLKRDAGIKMDHVPFRGAAPLVQELLSGRIQLGGDQISTSLGHMRGGRAAWARDAVADAHRAAAGPADRARAGLSQHGAVRLERLLRAREDAAGGRRGIQAEMAKAARDPDVKRRLGEVGAEVMGSTQEELAEVLRDAGRGGEPAGGGTEAGGA